MSTRTHARKDASSEAIQAPRLRTLLLTDLCDSTALVERIGDNAAAALFREHDRRVVKLQQQWRGRLIDRSDGLLLLFDRPIDGLGFALDYARGLKAMGDARALTLCARQGLHVGEVLTWRNSDEAVSIGAKPLEVEGLAKPTAARLMSMARPGQILISAVAESLTHRAARELGTHAERLLWKSHGRWRFKGVPTPMEIYEVGEIDVTPLRAPRHSPKAWRDIPLWRRPAALLAETLLVVTVCVSVWFFTRAEPAIAFAERGWVVVGDLRNLTGNTLLDSSLEQALRISLEQSRYVNVLSDMKVRDTMTRMKRDPDSVVVDRAIASEVAMRDGASAVILPTVAEIGGKLRFSVELVDPRTQTTVYSEFVQGDGLPSALLSVDQVTRKLRQGLGEVVASIDKHSVPLPAVTTSSLDALRAYALGVDATVKGQWSQGMELFERAVGIDPEFALAYLGAARIKVAISDRDGALPYLDQAIRFRRRLPERDQLYLDAWAAELRAPEKALPLWRTLASLYPDNFAGTANASWHLFVANRFAEALPYAQAADVPQDPLRAIATDRVGRILLAQGKAEAALKYFVPDDVDRAGPLRRRASALASLNRYAEAQQALDTIVRSGYVNDDVVPLIDRTSIAIDQADWMAARASIAQALTRSKQADDFLYRQFLVIALTTDALTDPATPTKLKPTFDRLTSAVTDDRLAMANQQDNAAMVLIVASHAQRSGDDSLTARALEAIKPALVHETPVLADLRAIVEAQHLALTGDRAAAIAHLSVGDDTLVQTRVALYALLTDSGRHAEALQQARWLSLRRGRAYIEANASQTLQPLNVADARLAQLWMAESLHALGRTHEAREQAQAFVRAWPVSRLPAYLRTRVERMLSDSKAKITV
ncbi:putative peptide modification system cyclase [Xanthomonas hortorum]|uniref:Peptide modification system cyclase n=2 Tax=Xanthomonas hortorum TaxID=56454 RepID=A0A6V7BHV4_9XANT|nr:putative peptide modification system cyclase [Xanthomonas hortorum]MCE4354453.1 putative peptide modification system cyclase [Xanthomonas hortorum pv. pelargonii]MCM5522599.1 putative peptide modification system cyclase [Xanthomonas hortorum pv. pelargonii]MCM5534523.1 putative peptide modification system cyclase [Xanthomonas hortorum pv. pelargonii]MCM5539332.1 putative peptide modification system cyclase [Xanthomonas hortorum pv. pelargonii]MCM5543098.1 putative peptide modification syste